MFKEMLRQLLISAYTRLNDRDLYAEILDAHLKDRRKVILINLFFKILKIN